MGDQERAGLVEALRRFEQGTRAAYGARMHAEVIPTSLVWRSILVSCA